MAYTKTINFESADDLTLFNYLGGWFRTTVSPFSGSYCLTNKDIGDSQETYCTMEVDIKVPGSVAFRYRTDSESNYDFLRFYVDGVSVLDVSGANGAWTQFAAYTLPVGVHTLKWRYSKNSSASTPADAVYIDDIQIAGLLEPYFFDTLRITSASQVVNFDTLRFPGVFIGYDTRRDTVRVPSLNQSGSVANQAVAVVNLAEQAVNTGSALCAGIPPAFSFSPDSQIPLYLFNSSPTKSATKQPGSGVVPVASSTMAGTDPIPMSFYYRIFPPIIGKLVTVTLIAYSKAVTTSSMRLGAAVFTVSTYTKAVKGDLLRNMWKTLSVVSSVEPINTAVGRLVQTLRKAIASIQPVTTKVIRFISITRLAITSTRKLSTVVTRSMATTRTAITRLRPVRAIMYRMGSGYRAGLNYTDKVSTEATRVGEGVRKPKTHTKRAHGFTHIKQICVRKLTSITQAMKGYVDTWYPPERKKLLSIIPTMTFLGVNINIKDRRIEVGLMKECQLGNTARFSATFRNWDGVVMDPVLVKFRILSSHQGIIFEVGVTEEDNRKAVGSYFVDYAPTATGSYIYEWYAEIDGTPAVKRGNFMVKRTLL